ncbi:MAG: tetratricopeptide repeat protein [Chitinivibrionales bacterium]|nr:tetratricopeptide repeat protein [Chitinivibrionales bacterium]
MKSKRTILIMICALVAVVGAAGVLFMTVDPLQKKIIVANRLLESGDFLGARRLYEAIIDKQPHSYAGHYGLGMSWCAEAMYKTELGLDKTEDWFSAIYHMTIAMNIRQDEQVLKTLAILHFNLGTCFKKINDTDNAIKLMEQALTYDPTLLKALNLLGALFHEKRNYQEAQRYYQKVIELQPEYAMAYFNLGALSWAQRDYKHAVTYFQKAVSLDTGNAYFRNWLAKAQEQVDNQ